MGDIPYPSERLKWLSSMITDLRRLDEDWYTADLLDHKSDPLHKTFVIRRRTPMEDNSWVVTQRIIRRWAEWNDCLPKYFKRYPDRIELTLLLKYLNRTCDYSPYDKLPAPEARWRKLNRIKPI